MIDPLDVCAVLLAAGRSQRFAGNNKLLAVFDGRPLVLHAADRIISLGTAGLIAVCGSEDVADLLRPLGYQIVMNPDPQQGLASSLALGIGAAREASAALVSLGDMPLVSLDHLRSLMARFDTHDAPVVGSRTGEVTMPPAIFSRSLFDRLLTGQGDHGARALLSSATYVPASADELADVDTVQDLRRLTPSRAIDPDACPV